ncbi:MAG: hypothetical protein IPN29_01785 [Saprospiraceae bacterium]|nr:hypothetical protein [Saprospiraceae bacterium]
MAHQKNIYTIVSTNAHFLDKATCEKLLIQDWIESSYPWTVIVRKACVSRKYRVEGQVDKVIQRPKIWWKPKEIEKPVSPYLILQTIVFKHNEQELGEIKLA